MGGVTINYKLKRFLLFFIYSIFIIYVITQVWRKYLPNA